MYTVSNLTTIADCDVLLNMANKEAADIKEMMLKDGIKDEVQPYDWRYYAEKIRKERFDLDVYYVQHISFIFDCKILFLTFITLFDFKKSRPQKGISIEPFEGQW